MANNEEKQIKGITADYILSLMDVDKIVEGVKKLPDTIDKERIRNFIKGCKARGFDIGFDAYIKDKDTIHFGGEGISCKSKDETTYITYNPYGNHLIIDIEKNKYTEIFTKFDKWDKNEIITDKGTKIFVEDKDALIIHEGKWEYEE